MKGSLHNFAALLCLLTVLVSSMSCGHLAMAARPQAIHQQAASGQCPMHSPQSKNIPSCCSAAQQTPAAITTAIIQQPIFFSITLLSLPADQIAPSLQSLSAQLVGSPPLPPRITLRI